ncbi:MAG: enoyl-CoA hydratase/isomerase family protein [Azospirillum sp.]|nr:enoyl-CoA hydratase/isomerase family protein [Azospirillum sp.]
MTNLSHLISRETPAAHVVLLKINRPEKKNALHSTMVIELARLLDEAAVDIDVRAVVLTGTDETFAAGADIAEMLERGPAGTSNNPDRVKAWRRLEKFPKPIIAAVNGIAFGAGNELALTCDFIIAGKNAKFGQPEVKIGGMAGDGGTQRLPRKIGANMASYMLMTGDPIDVDTAWRLGYVIEICEVAKTVARAVEIAATIASRAPVAVQFTKACIGVAVGATHENGISYERDSLWRNSMAEDRREGMSAFVEKRAPKFSGR